MTTTLLASFPSPARGVWYLGPFPIRAYALFIIVGIVAALLIGDRRWAARGGERGVIFDIALWAVPFGLIGGRLYHVITDWPKYFGADGAGIIGALRIWDGGLGIWGAVALGGVGAWIGCRLRGIPLPAFGDAIAPGIVLAQAIGRIGNYFNQELYGRPTTLPWGLEIYERRSSSGVVSPDLASGVSTGQLHSIVHPTFLYELLWNVAVFAVLIWVDRKFRLGHGRLFAVYVAGYCLGRFWIELLRSDPASMIADIRVNSFTSTIVFIGAVVYIMVAPKGREAPETLQGKALSEEEEDSVVEEFVKELSAVGATSGVVAAAKVAAEDEVSEGDAEESSEEAEAKAEAAAEDQSEPEGPAEELAADTAEAEGEEPAEEAAVEDDEEPAEETAVEDDEEPAGEPAADTAEAEGEEPAEEAAVEDDEAEAEPAADDQPEGETEATAEEPAEEEPAADTAEAKAEEPSEEAAAGTEDEAAHETEQPAAESDPEGQVEAESEDFEAAGESDEAESAELTGEETPEADEDTEDEAAQPASDEGGRIRRWLRRRSR